MSSPESPRRYASGSTGKGHSGPPSAVPTILIDVPSRYGSPTALRKFLASLAKMEQRPEVKEARAEALDNLKFIESRNS